MKDIKSYIETGVLELYVLGQLTIDEKLEVERLSETYPEIRDELLEIERALEAFAHSQGREPAPGIRDRILNSTVAAGRGTQIHDIHAEKGNFYKYAFAACLVLLILSWSAILVLYNRMDSFRQEIAVLETSNQQFSRQVNDIKRELNHTAEIFNHPDFRIVRLEGTRLSPASRIVVAFNPKTEEVLVDLTGLKMPENDPEHQYQLWAIVDGKPVDLGIFDVGEENSGLKQMKPAGEPQAFAVTLERKGGSPTPTMENMMVMGAI